MDTGLSVLTIGALLITSLLMRNAAARHVTVQQVPPCLHGRLLLRNRTAHSAMLLAVAVAVVGAVIVASQIATEW